MKRLLIFKIIIFSLIMCVLFKIFKIKDYEYFNPTLCEKASIYYMDLSDVNVKEFKKLLTKDFDYNSVVYNKNSYHNINTKSSFFIIDYDNNITYTIINQYTEYLSRYYIIKCYFNDDGIYKIKHKELIDGFKNIFNEI